MITVMGATGRTGGRIVEQLRALGHPVRALGRSASKLAATSVLGAECRAGDATDAGFLTEAFGGSDAVFTLMPYDPTVPDYRAAQDRLGASVAQAIRATGVPHVVFFSSVGAELASGTGFIASLHEQEERLRALDGTNVLVLRSGALFENFHAVMDQIRHEGTVADSVDPDVRLPMVATRDIGDVAARALAARDWSGFVVRELLGQRDISYAEATRILGGALDMPTLGYVQVPPDEMKAALVQAGYSDDFARLHVELNAAISAGRVQSTEGRSAANTTPTSFEQFAEELALLFRTA